MQRTITRSGLASFLLALLGGVLTFGLLNATSVSAQSSPPAEVRASAGLLNTSDWPLRVEVMEPTPLYSFGGAHMGTAEVGDWYRVVWQEEGWVQGVRESEPNA